MTHLVTLLGAVTHLVKKLGGAVAVTHLVELYCGRDSSGQIFGRAVTHLLGAHKSRRSRDSSGHTLWGP